MRFYIKSNLLITVAIAFDFTSDIFVYEVHLLFNKSFRGCCCKKQQRSVAEMQGIYLFLTHLCHFDHYLTLCPLQVFNALDSLRRFVINLRGSKLSSSCFIHDQPSPSLSLLLTFVLFLSRIHYACVYNDSSAIPPFNLLFNPFLRQSATHSAHLCYDSSNRVPPVVGGIHSALWKLDKGTIRVYG